MKDKLIVKIKNCTVKTDLYCMFQDTKNSTILHKWTFDITIIGWKSQQLIAHVLSHDISSTGTRFELIPSPYALTFALYVTIQLISC